MLFYQLLAEVKILQPPFRICKMFIILPKKEQQAV